MSRILYYLYLVQSKAGAILGLSHNPQLDLACYRRSEEIFGRKIGLEAFEVLKGPLPLAAAFSMLQRIGDYSAGRWLPKGNTGSLAMSRSPGGTERRALAETALPHREMLTFMRRVLAGSILLHDEAEALLSKAGYNGSSTALTDALQILCLKGAARLLPAVSQTAEGQWVCRRCGGDRRIVLIACPDCGGECYQCEQCIAMGAAKACTPLWLVEGAALEQPVISASSAEQTVCAQLDFRLTPAQRDAARAVLAYAASPPEVSAGIGRSAPAWGSSPAPGRHSSPTPPRHSSPTPPQHSSPAPALHNNDTPAFLLVHAAAGAGKTEVSYGAIAYTLRLGGRVLFAVPRRDVVRELAPRLKLAFPGVAVGVLYGGSPERFARTGLVLATTHQVLRCYHAFDLVILDEADAYPYRDSAMLHFAVQRAAKPGGRLVLMTATPAPEHLSGSTTVVTLPARHHGHPLPEPLILTETKSRFEPGNFRIHPRVLELICTTVNQDCCRLFIFVPRVNMTEAAACYLKTVLANPPFNQEWADRIGFVHASDPNRDKKIQGFQTGEIPVLVTTSLLERGITISRSNVLVLLADAEWVFDNHTLVQIAGRAGRTTEYPTGRVWFVGRWVSPAMKAAVRQIKALNKEARLKGYLKRT